MLKVLHELHTAMKTHHNYQSEFRQAESKLQVQILDFAFSNHRDMVVTLFKNQLSRKSMRLNIRTRILSLNLNGLLLDTYLLFPFPV